VGIEEQGQQGVRYSVVVPAYQAADIVGQCVAALGVQSMPRDRYEVLVVDDGSTDETETVAAAAGADAVLRIPHGGPAAARNAGMAAAQGEIVLMTDADCVPSPGWIAAMVAPFADPAVMGTKGSYRTKQQGLIARLVQLEYEIRYERMARLPSIDFIDTYAAAYRRDVLEKERGFSTIYPLASVEDVDLSFRVARRGRLIFVPEAWVWHRHPSTLRAYLRRKAMYGYWRALLYIKQPDKAAGDSHTDPMLKVQFVLVAAMVFLGVMGVLCRPVRRWLWGGAGVAKGAFMATTLPFVRWAWGRDRTVAAVWPGVVWLRALVQGTGLAVGLVAHRLRRMGRAPEMGQDDDARTP
jgi:glycosyltransferase involved in cell wall biosynthesis